MTFRKPLKITSRTSSIANSFVQAILPHIVPTPAQIDEALHVLGMTQDNRICAYCGTPATDWDHLRPIVCGERPTGFIDEIRNLVPSCGPCNQSKGASDWRTWMTGTAPGSPKSRNVPDIQSRIDRLQKFEEWGQVRRLPLSDWVGADIWKAHWANLDDIKQKMKSAQIHAAEMQTAIAAGLASYRKGGSA